MFRAFFLGTLYMCACVARLKHCDARMRKCRVLPRACKVPYDVRHDVLLSGAHSETKHEVGEETSPKARPFGNTTSVAGENA